MQVFIFFYSWLILEGFYVNSNLFCAGNNWDVTWNKPVVYLSHILKGSVLTKLLKRTCFSIILLCRLTFWVLFCHHFNTMGFNLSSQSANLSVPVTPYNHRCHQFPSGIVSAKVTAANKNPSTETSSTREKQVSKFHLISVLFSVWAVFSVLRYLMNSQMLDWNLELKFRLTPKTSQGKKTKIKRDEWTDGGREYLNSLRRAELKALFPACLE